VPQVVDYLSSRKVLTTELVPGKPARFRTWLLSKYFIGWFESPCTLLFELPDRMECRSSVFVWRCSWFLKFFRKIEKRKREVWSLSREAPLSNFRFVTVATSKEDMLFLRESAKIAIFESAWVVVSSEASLFCKVVSNGRFGFQGTRPFLRTTVL
jgi:hypothetical protein